MALMADAPRTPGDRRVDGRARVAALLAVHLALAAGLVALSAANAGRLGSVDHLLGVGAAFALVGLLPMEVELGRTTFSFTLGPLGIVLTVALGEAIAGLTQRRGPLELAYHSAAVRSFVAMHSTMA